MIRIILVEHISIVRLIVYNPCYYHPFYDRSFFCVLFVCVCVYTRVAMLEMGLTFALNPFVIETNQKE